jgi:HPr kinase/phosphorylase
VEVKQVAENVLVGMAPELLKYYIEVRGLGIIDVRTVFGAAAVRNDIKIELVAELMEWEDHCETDRLGIDEEKIKILDSRVNKKTIPIRPGRNVAAILEVAAMDFRLKSIGINGALEFSHKLFDSINNK